MKKIQQIMSRQKNISTLDDSLLEFQVVFYPINVLIKRGKKGKKMSDYWNYCLKIYQNALKQVELDQVGFSWGSGSVKATCNLSRKPRRQSLGAPCMCIYVGVYVYLLNGIVHCLLKDVLFLYVYGSLCLSKSHPNPACAMYLKDCYNQKQLYWLKAESNV